MKYLLIFAVTLAVASAQYYESQPEGMELASSGLHTGDSLLRQRRDVTVDRKVGDGKVYGTVGQDDAGLFGKAGYQRNIFNDERGKLDGQVYGRRVLGPYGDSSHAGGLLNWQKSNAAASLDVSKQIHGGSTVDAAAGGKWPLGKNADLSAKAFYTRTQGAGHDYGGRAEYNYRW